MGPRRRRIRHPVNVQHLQDRTRGERISDAVASRVGSWPFILIQSALLALWIVYNGVVAVHLIQGKPFDPYPFILLNLALSFQAAYTGPVVMMSQNRQAAKDRDMAEHDFVVNQRSFDHMLWQDEQIEQLLRAAGLTPTRERPDGSPSDGSPSDG